jgi:hypothetical protein
LAHLSGCLAENVGESQPPQKSQGGIFFVRLDKENKSASLLKCPIRVL